MVNAQLTPPSGHAGSYYDIQFFIELDKKCTGYITIYNQTANEKLKILSCSTGVIENETDIKISNTNRIQGIINIFNDDKMNLKLNSKDYVVIKILFSGETKEETTIKFYNESNSVDSGILPFDINCKNNRVTNRDPIILNIYSNEEKRLEFCIQRENQKEPKYFFEVLTKKGKTTVNIPVEILYSDLNIKKYWKETFKLYYIKFEGFDYNGFLNRKFIPIFGIDLSFQSPKISLKKIDRYKPTNILSDDFVIDPNYHVFVHESFSINIKDSPEKLKNMSRFLFESIDMNNMAQFQIMAEGLHKEIGSNLQKEALIKISNKIIIPQIQNKPYLAPFSSVESTNNVLPNVTSKEKKGGCGCSRKKHNV